MKVALNDCYGGFNLSSQAVITLAALKGITLVRSNDLTSVFAEYATSEGNSFYAGELWYNRTDPDLIQVIEDLGPAADGFCAQLRIAEVPDDIEWHIDEYDGIETVEENHRSW